MKFCWTTLYVNDMEESLKFYQEVVGLKINQRFQAGEETEIVFLGDGETKVELICSKDHVKVDLGKDISMGFEVSSLEDMLRFVKEKGVDVHSGPFSPNPNTQFFYVLDPNDLKIQFIEQK